MYCSQCMTHHSDRICIPLLKKNFYVHYSKTVYVKYYEKSHTLSVLRLLSTKTTNKTMKNAIPVTPPPPSAPTTP